MEKEFKRDLEEKVFSFVGGKEAVVVYGPRRSGKSFFCTKLAEKYARESKARFKAINFEEPKYNQADYKTLDEVSNGFGKKDLLLLDEVQNVGLWEKWVRKCVDDEQTRLVVTGSSAKLLSTELATSLAGRSIGFELLPLSYCEAHKGGIAFDEWLEYGGLPEVLKKPLEQKDELLKSYYETMLLRDVAQRFEVRDFLGLKNVCEWLLTEIGNKISLNKIRAVTGLSYDTARNYLSHLETGYLALTVPYFSYSLKKSMTRERKAYAFDLGIQKIASKTTSRDYGRKIENAVALELRRRGYELYYYQGKREVDFIAKKTRELTAINVCATEKMPEREFEGLEEVKQTLKIKNAFILSLGQTQEKENTKNLKEWLLKPENNLKTPTDKKV